MREVTEALIEYEQAKAVIEWLQENGDLPKHLDAHGLAYQYAIRYKTPAVKEVFQTAIDKDTL